MPVLRDRDRHRDTERQRQRDIQVLGPREGERVVTGILNVYGGWGGESPNVGGVKVFQEAAGSGIVTVIAKRKKMRTEMEGSKPAEPRKS